MPIKRNIPGEEGYDPGLPVTAETREYQIWPGGAAYVRVRYVGDEDRFHDLKVIGPDRQNPQKIPVRPERAIVTEAIRAHKILMKAEKHWDLLCAEKGSEGGGSRRG